MTTTGTYNFNPNLGEIVLYAFNMAGIRTTSILQEHMESAKMATNMMLARWSNKGVNLWKVDLVTEPMIAGQSTYNVDPSTVMILDAYMSLDNGSGATTDRIILPVSRGDYASYPNKSIQGTTTVFWFDRLISPTITLWPVPDGASAQFLKYYRVTRIQDASLKKAQTVDIPYRWLEAFADGLAYRLAKIWTPAAAPALAAVAQESFDVAAEQDTENVPFFVSPMIGGYYRT